jgi:hypothetical protein
MTRHLQIVREEPQGSAYVVARTQNARPGTPFVLAHCADRAVASIFALAGQEVCSRTEMERDPALAQALAAWEADDHRLFDSERAARSALRGPERRETMRMIGRHPSQLGKQLP